MPYPTFFFPVCSLQIATLVATNANLVAQLKSKDQALSAMREKKESAEAKSRRLETDLESEKKLRLKLEAFLRDLKV